jgi:hypothetical protein
MDSYDGLGHQLNALRDKLVYGGPEVFNFPYLLVGIPLDNASFRLWILKGAHCMILLIKQSHHGFPYCRDQKLNDNVQFQNLAHWLCQSCQTV